MINQWLKKRNVLQKSYKINPDILNQPFINSHIIDDLYQLIDPLVSTYYKNMSKKETLIAIFKETPDLSILSKSSIFYDDVWQKIQLTKSIIKCYFTQLLEKSVDKKSWTRISKAHKPEQMADIDHKPHLGNTPPHYVKALESDIKMSPLDTKENAPGIAPKMLHVVPIPQTKANESLDHKPELTSGMREYLENNGYERYYKNDVVMAKPYFRPPSRGLAKSTSINVPGWATMATKKLYDAGGLSHMIEDVTAHEHQGVPITVHKFSKDYTTLCGVRPKVDPLQTYQMGVMDFLTGNTDRHMGNVMVNTKDIKNGYDPLLAIDHERSFLYDRAVGDIGSYFDPSGKLFAPYKYFHHMPQAGVPRNESITESSSPLRYNTENKLAAWWLKHKDNIKTEFENNLSQIKNQGMRDHLRVNFNNRFEAFHNWAESVDQFGAENHEPLTHSNSSVFAERELYKNFKSKK